MKGSRGSKNEPKKLDSSVVPEVLKAPENGALALLGNNYENTSPPPDENQLEKMRFELQKSQRNRRDLLTVQHGIRRLIIRRGEEEGKENPIAWHRTGLCRYAMLGALVGWNLTPEKRAFVSGTMICGSVWTCPVCTALIQEQRRQELAKVMEWARAKGFVPVMVTLTFPHRAWQSIEELLAMQAKALILLRKGAPWDRFKKFIGYQAHVRSLEITYGQNGWHPHTHEMYFIRAGVDPELFTQKIQSLWDSACRRSGLLDLPDFSQAAFDKHAVDVKVNCSTVEYLVKLDRSKRRSIAADAEMTKSAKKTGYGGFYEGVHPFGLVDLFLQGSFEAGERFLDYVSAMKGKRQLVFSPGLKKRAGLQEKTDEEVADEAPVGSVIVAMMGDHDWSLVRGRNLPFALEALENGGFDGLVAYVRKRYEESRK